MFAAMPARTKIETRRCRNTSEEKEKMKVFRNMAYPPAYPRSIPKG